MVKDESKEKIFEINDLMELEKNLCDMKIEEHSVELKSDCKAKINELDKECDNEKDEIQQAGRKTCNQEKEDDIKELKANY